MKKNKNPVIDEFGRYKSYKTKEEAFYIHLDKFLNTDRCWSWKGCKDKNGYGRMTFNRKDYRAHRISWEITNGEIPQKMIICHSCDNPSCVNPNHLFLGTHKLNNQDMINKGRKKSFPGENNGMAILTENDVIEIRKWAKSGIKHGIIAYNFGVKKSYISGIVNNKTWKNIKSGGMDAEEHSAIGRMGTD